MNTSTAAPEQKADPAAAERAYHAIKGTASAQFKQGASPEVVAGVLLELAVLLGTARFGHAGMRDKLRAAADRAAGQVGL